MLEHELAVLKHRREAAAIFGHDLATAQIGVVIALVKATGAKDVEKLQKLLGVIGERIPQSGESEIGVAFRNWLTKANTIENKTKELAKRPDLWG